ncbi:P22 phage major capsid protein family protein [Marinobacterium nitratireducens]|uniref:P22 phage major capsid protein family protein n=1 Tax=Marinobacterium nitratireducens TaxID=518897 RepID=UPI001E2E9137|nr:P22 phage major capsid protein family protein [Marinobacterium nitratireducens]
MIPDIYAALDVVSRELVGLIPAVSSDMTFERAAVGQTVRSPVAPASTASDITPAVTPPNDGDQTIGNVDMSITKARRVPVRWNGEQSLGLNSGPGRANIMRDQFAQAMRALANEVEADLAALHIYASRAYGTAGTTPFATAGDFTDGSNVLKILKDNGAPGADNHLVIDTAAGASFLGKQARVDYAGSDTIQRQGILLPLHGMDIRESGQIVTSTAGTGASATTDNAGYAVGDTVITLAAAGTGTIVAGDVITFAGDSNKYVVLSGDTNVTDGGTITLAAPGLRKAIAASATNITVIAAAARNMAFNRSAIALATRAPALPVEGDSADDRQIVQDPRSGLAFEVSMYKQYRQVQYEVALAWGVKAVKPEHIALLLG